MNKHFGLQIKLTLFPPADSPEEQPEEDRATGVDSECVTQLVSAAGVVRRVNDHVVANEKVRKRAGHKRPLQRPTQESSRFGAFGEARRHVPHQEADTYGNYQES